MLREVLRVVCGVWHVFGVCACLLFAGPVLCVWCCGLLVLVFCLVVGVNLLGRMTSVWVFLLVVCCILVCGCSPVLVRVHCLLCWLGGASGGGWG